MADADYSTARYTRYGSKFDYSPVVLRPPTEPASQVPVITAGAAYASGNAIGGLLTFAEMANPDVRSGLIQDVLIHSKSVQSFLADLVLFHTNPTATTVADKTAFSLALADFDKVTAIISLSAWTVLGTPSTAQAAQLARSFKSADGNLYGVLVCRGTPTFASTSDLKVVVKTLKD